jgi:hypothetical protein
VFVALDEPVVVVVIAEALEGPVQVFEGGVGVDPEKLFFERSPEPLDEAVLPSGPRTKEGLESIPRNGSSAWKALETNWEPLSCRSFRLAAMAWSAPPKAARQAWWRGVMAS